MDKESGFRRLAASLRRRAPEAVRKRLRRTPHPEAGLLPLIEARSDLVAAVIDPSISESTLTRWLDVALRQERYLGGISGKPLDDGVLQFLGWPYRMIAYKVAIDPHGSRGPTVPTVLPELWRREVARTPISGEEMLSRAREYGAFGRDLLFRLFGEGSWRLTRGAYLFVDYDLQATEAQGRSGPAVLSLSWNEQRQKWLVDLVPIHERNRQDGFGPEEYFLVPKPEP